MIGTSSRIGYVMVAAAFGVFMALPLFALISFIVFEYDRSLASYVFVPVRVSDIGVFFAQPEMKVFGKLLGQSLQLSAIVFLYSFVLSFLFLLNRSLRDVTLVSLLLSLCFVVPAILKSYAWYRVMAVSPAWQYFALPAFLAVSLSVFYFSAIATRINSLGQNVLISLDEYFGRQRLVLELLRFCIGPSIFAALCIFSVVLFSGIEIEHLGRNIVTFGDVVSGFFGGREREAGFLSLLSLLFIGAISIGAVNLIWERNR